MNEEELLQEAMRRLEEEDTAQAPEATAAPSPQQQQSPADPSRPSSTGFRGVWDSIGAGMAKAGIETKDFIFGEPEEHEKSDFRRGIERRAQELQESSATNSVTMGISQIATGLIGAGKLMAPIKAVQKLKGAGTAGRAAYEVGLGAAAGAVVIDPHEERLSNLIEEFPALQNPVTDYLAADPSDSAAEGRFKNALEGIGVDFALIGVVKAIKYLRSGDNAAAKKEIAKLERGDYKNLYAEQSAARQAQADETARIANQNEFGLDFGPTPKEKPKVRVKAGSQVVEQSAPVKAAEGETVLDEIVVKPDDTLRQDGLREPIGPNGERATGADLDGPDVIRTREVSDQEIDTILRRAEADSKAIARYGTREAAAEAGHKFGTQYRLPWQKLRGTEDAMAFLRQSAKVMAARFDNAKGGAVMGDARVKALADELGKTFNEEPALILGQIAEAGSAAKDMVATMEAGMRVGNKMFLETNELATKIRLGKLEDFQGNLAAANEELKARLAATIDVMAATNSILANAGRAVRRARSDFRIRAADLAAIKELDPERIAIIMEKAEGDVSKIMLLANRTWAQRVMDQSIFHLTNGLLWMWPTHLVNMTTNAFMLAARPTEKLFGSAALRLITKDPGRRAELSSISRQALREYTYTVATIGDGWQAATEAFLRGDSILSPHNTEYFQKGTTGVSTGQIPWKPVNSVVDLVQNAWMAASYQNIVGLPTRALGAADEFFKTIRYRAVVQSRAAVEAADRGLDEAATRAYIQKSLDNAIDPASGRALYAKALREAQMTSFQQDLDYETTFGGNIGRGLTNMRRTAPILSWVLPFVKTPVNVIRYGIKLTPGLNVAQKEFRDAMLGKAGPEAQAHAIGQMSMGMLFTAYAAHLVSQGRFTGGGPDGPNDYKLQQELTATGWRPYSYVWTDSEGNTKYLQVGRFDPAGMAMGLVADVVEIMQKDPEGDHTALIGAVAVAVAKNLGEKSFLLNLNSAIRAALAPEKELAKWAGRTASSMLPASSLLRGTNPDPYLREARTFVDQFKRGLPGLSKSLPKSHTVFGEPIERTVGVIGNQKPDILEAEHNRIMLQTGKGIGKPDPKFEGVDLRDVTLEKNGQNAYERFQELSGQIPGRKSLRSILERLIKSNAYQDMPDGEAGVVGTRLNALSRTVQEYRQAARSHLIRENPDLQPLVKQRQRAARGAILENRNSRQTGGGARALLDALGTNQQ